MKVLSLLLRNQVPDGGIPSFALGLNESPELIAQELQYWQYHSHPYPGLNESPELIAQESGPRSHTSSVRPGPQ